MRISDWSSDVCSSDLLDRPARASHRVMVDYAALPFKPDGCRFEFRGDGSVLITPGYDLPTLWPSIPPLFVDRARRFPDRPFVARRERLADGRRGEVGRASGRERGGPDG